MSDPLTFTDSNGADCTLRVERTRECGELGDFSTRTLDLATLPDLIAALARQGYAVVRVTGEEPTAEALRTIVDGVTAGSLLAGVGVSDPICRALFRAGAASRQSEVDRLTARVAELEQRLALIAVLAHDRDGDSHEWRSRRLGDCSALTQFTKDRGVLGHVKLADSWAKRAEAAEAELAAAKAKLAEVAQERDDAAKSAEYLAKRYNATSDELERARWAVEVADHLWRAIHDGNVHMSTHQANAAFSALAKALRDALASAAPAADRAEAARKDGDS